MFYIGSDRSNYIFHRGTPHDGGIPHSGRYPWGSGDTPYQHSTSFLGTVKAYRDQGFTDTDIAKMMGMTTTEFRKQNSINVNEKKAAERAQAIKLREHGYSYTEIGRIMGKNESSIRSILDPVRKEKQEKTNGVVAILKDTVSDTNYIDIGPGSAQTIGVTDTRLKTAVQQLVNEGYTTHVFQVEQLGNPGKYTTMKVLAPAGVTKSDVLKNQNYISPILGYTSEDGGRTFQGLQPPTSVDSSRIKVNYYEDGGVDKDGVIELRRGVEDLSLGDKSYAQVRIQVDGTHYIKGVAVYGDNMPDGVDIIVNSHKHVGTPLKGTDNENSVLKNVKKDPSNPFGASIKTEAGIIVGQRNYIDKDGKTKLSPINIVREEGDWDTWSKSLASQMLSKQEPALAKKQLNLKYQDSKSELDEIISLTQPEIKVKLLNEFAEKCDADASELKAAALPRQSSKVILPINSLKDNEIYAPYYKNGEEVVLVRYPTGGTFEMPRLIVNNYNKEGKRIISNGVDAVGINSKVASQLSGADFDGDTVIVIPTAGYQIKTSAPLEGLKGFDPQETYKGYEGMKVMSKRATQTQMGKITNLINDMTIMGADTNELARAVRHSMVVIDANKHKLNYIQSEKDNGIAELKTKYQGGANKGASTLVSRAGAEKHISYRTEKYLSSMTDEEKARYYQGEKIWETKPRYRYQKQKDGTYKQVEILKEVTRMDDTDDAFTLVSEGGGRKMEIIYATHANKMKALANEARKEARTTSPSKYSPSARVAYQTEVSSLKSKLDTALSNKPLERVAQISANIIVRNVLKDNPDMSKEDKKKVGTMTLNEQRRRVGANKKSVYVDITDKEWEAILSGAVSSSMITDIINNTDPDKFKERARPRATNELTATQISRIKTLSANGYTLAEIAEKLGVSSSTVGKYTK